MVLLQSEVDYCQSSSKHDTKFSNLNTEKIHVSIKASELHRYSIQIRSRPNSFSIQNNNYKQISNTSDKDENCFGPPGGISVHTFHLCFQISWILRHCAFGRLQTRTEIETNFCWMGMHYQLNDFMPFDKQVHSSTIRLQIFRHHWWHLDEGIIFHVRKSWNLIRVTVEQYSTAVCVHHLYWA